jgi:uncharacterized protein
MKTLKNLDVIVWILLVIGGINWGLVGFFDFNLVARLFGPMSMATRVIYSLVGLSAIYDIVAIKAIFRRWHLHFEEEHRHVETPTAV